MAAAALVTKALGGRERARESFTNNEGLLRTTPRLVLDESLGTLIFGPERLSFPPHGWKEKFRSINRIVIVSVVAS
jgi:hypothetical protein